VLTDCICRLRDVAHSHPDHTDSEYIFDLDGDENDEDIPIHHPLYSVDSKLSGESPYFFHTYIYMLKVHPMF